MKEKNTFQIVGLFLKEKSPQSMGGGMRDWWNFTNKLKLMTKKGENFVNVMVKISDDNFFLNGKDM